MEPPTVPQKKNRKTRSSVDKAAAATMDLASLLSDRTSPEARLVTDMPLGKGKGEIRLVLIDGPRRISVWADTMEEATRQLMEKANDP